MGFDGDSRRPSGWPRRAALVRPFEQVGPVELARDSQQQVAGDVTGLVIRAHLAALQRADALFGPQHAAPQRMPGKMRLHEVFIGRVRGLIVVHADLFQDHLFLDVEILLAQRRADDVGQEIERFREIFGEHGSVEQRRLFAGGGIVLGSHFVKDAIDVVGRMPLGAFEDHVFEKVADSGHLVGLVARAGADEKPQCHAVHAGAALGDNLQAVRQPCLIKLQG